MDDLSEIPAVSLNVELLFGCLGVPDERLGAIATELLGRAGRAAVPWLACEAVERTNGAERRLRALLAVQKIGLLDMESSVKLFPLVYDCDPMIQTVAREIFRSGVLAFT